MNLSTVPQGLPSGPPRGIGKRRIPDAIIAARSALAAYEFDIEIARLFGGRRSPRFPDHVAAVDR